MLQLADQGRPLSSGPTKAQLIEIAFLRVAYDQLPIFSPYSALLLDSFALLDAAVRMQPMPAAYLSTLSNVYCQDCEKTGQCKYHFVGQKCPNCGSYNTRELGRVQATDP